MRLLRNDAECLALLLVVAGACTSTKRPSPAQDVEPPSNPVEQGAAPEPGGVVHHFSDNWGSGLGCTPKGPVLSLEGTVVVRPFGKGTDGAVLATEGEAWVLSYRAEGVLLELNGKPVVARGRACDKRGAAVFGPHLDLATLTES